MHGAAMRWVATLFLGLTLVAAEIALAQDQKTGSGWLGVEVHDLTQQDADAFGWEAPRGAMLVGPTPGGPAASAELQPGDVLISLDGVEIENVKSLIETIGRMPAGTDIKLALRRDGREKRLTVRLATRPPEPGKPKVKEDGPMPMLDTGGHMALVRDIAFTPDSRQLVSASIDKTIRVWDLETGKTERIIRGESGSESHGAIHAMALSPDGKWVAVGGSLRGPQSEYGAIRLFDFASGRLAAVLPGHVDTVLSLAFSPDSRHLISGSGGVDSGVTIWDVATRQPLRRLRDLRTSYGIGFTSDGSRVVTGSEDQLLRLWSVADGTPLSVMEGHQRAIFSLAVSPDGTIASGDWDGEIRLWDGRTGALLKTLAKQNAVVGSLSFNPDGSLLLSSDGKAPSEAHVFDVASGSEIVTYRGHDGAIVATAISPDGRWAATAGGQDYGIQLWDVRTGARRSGSAGQPLILRGRGGFVASVGFSADSASIAWGNADPCPGQSCVNHPGPLQYTMRLPAADGFVGGPQVLGKSATAEANAPTEETFQRALTRYGTQSLSHRQLAAYAEGADTLDISEDGKIVHSIWLHSISRGIHTAYSFTADGKAVISADGTGTIQTYIGPTPDGRGFIGHDSAVLAIAPSPDGRYLVSGAHDQTVRLWNIKTQELLVSLFQGEGDEWVMWTPQGYYAASGPGAELIGWQINRGVEREAEYVTASQLRKPLHRPDIVARAIQLASAEAAVKEAHGTNFKLADLLAKPVPRFRITSPSRNAVFDGGAVQLTIELEETADPVKVIRIQVNGRQVAEHLPRNGGGFAAGMLQFAVPLANGRNTVRLTAVNEAGESSAELPLTLASNGDLDRRGTLYLLAIGVDIYPNIPGNDLRFSSADATAFANVMEKQVGALHERVVKRVLVNAGGGKTPIWRQWLKRAPVEQADAPTAANIMNALGVLSQARETDTVMVFVAGHAINEGPNYRFLPTDAAKSEGRFLPASIVPWYAFQEAIESAKGRRILFLDTCHSGNSYNQRLSNDSYQANIIVYSAARWDQLALEREDLGHGLFTYATLEGIAGKAAHSDAGGQVTTLALRDFLVARVAELARELGHRQEPQYFRGRDAENYTLAWSR
jgi:WD40 repeat protein